MNIFFLFISESEEWFCKPTFGIKIRFFVFKYFLPMLLCFLLPTFFGTFCTNFIRNPFKAFDIYKTDHYFFFFLSKS